MARGCYSCHSSSYAAHKTANKELQSRFYLPTLFKDAQSFVERCDKCQRARNLSKRYELPQNPILEVELFHVWGIDFMGPFPSSYVNLYILVVVDYVSKWVKALASPTNDSKVVQRFLKNNIFTRFGVPRTLISDEGKHFCNQQLKALLVKYGVRHKNITHKSAGKWRTTFKTPLGMSPYNIVLGKECHLLVELEHKAYWAIKLLNFDPSAAGQNRMLQLNALDEFRREAYENAHNNKDKVMIWHDRKITRKDLYPGQKVLLFNSRLKLHQGKLKSRWYGSYTITSTTPYGAITIMKDGQIFKMNGHKLKPYLTSENMPVHVVILQDSP
ncbi:hypothetical protein L6164_023944 [Bauhinia variegata]|uniref:Uncharacterized protein n=1 Tax=Bauhinia variegata TaxID=167791 RepID=A0ACB9LWY6_BAUVA|nr:hypothetical protein L6164_023944 [Bauhinia variegata]